MHRADHGRLGNAHLDSTENAFMNNLIAITYGTREAVAALG
jgi:hypothetical protein